MDYLRSGNKQRRIETIAHDVREEQVGTVVKAKDVSHFTEETAPLSPSSFLTPSVVFSEAPKSYFRIYECPFQEIL